MIVVKKKRKLLAGIAVFLIIVACITIAVFAKEEPMVIVHYVGKGYKTYIITENKFVETGAYSETDAPMNKIDQNLLAKKERIRVIIKTTDNGRASEIVNSNEGKIIDKVNDKIIADISSEKLQEIAKDSSIQYIEEDQDIKSDDPSISVLSDSITEADLQQQTIGYNVLKTKANEAWNLATGKGIKIAVIDSGISEHPDLNVAGGTSFIDNSYSDSTGHGTLVAGVLAAKNNEIGAVGIAPDAELYSVKIMADSGKLSDAIKGIRWSIDNDMDIIVMSFGLERYSKSFEEAINEAYSKGILLIAAAGNSNAEIMYPAKYNSVIAVGSINENNERSSFSSFGDKLELMEAGQNVLSTHLDGYAYASGTSLAAPAAAGIAALMKQKDPLLTNEQIRQKLAGGAVDLGALGRDAYFGYGLGAVDFAADEVKVENEKNENQKTEANETYEDWEIKPMDQGSVCGPSGENFFIVYTNSTNSLQGRMNDNTFQFSPVNSTTSETYGLQVRKESLFNSGNKSVYRYHIKNVGIKYQRNTTVFPADNVIDPMFLGINTLPSLINLHFAFVDLDSDGKYELITSAANYYKNKGNLTNPNWVRNNSVLIPIQSYNATNLNFADLDNDSDYDLCFTNDSWYSFTSRMICFRNTGNKYSPSWTLDLNLIPGVNTTFGANRYSPFFVDLNGDGKKDLVIEGIQYYENNGTLTVPSFKRNDSFLNNLSGAGENIQFIDLDNDGKYDYVTDIYGSGLLIVRNNGTTAKPSWDYNSNISFRYSNGWRQAFYFIDLDNDTILDMVFSHDFYDSGGTDQFKLYFAKGVSQPITIRDVRFIQMYNFLCYGYYSWNSHSNYYPEEDYIEVSGEGLKFDRGFKADILSSAHGTGDSGLRYHDIQQYLPPSAPWWNGQLNNEDSYNLAHDKFNGQAIAMQYNLGDLAFGDEKDITFTRTYVDPRENKHNIALPNLLIDDLDLIKVNDTAVNITFKIKNIGTSATNGEPVEFMMNDVFQNVFYSESVYFLNQSITVNESVGFSTTMDVENGHTIRVFIDPKDRIRELYELDNEASKTFHKTFYLSINAKPAMLNSVIEDYFESKLSDFNKANDASQADYVIYVGENGLNSITLDGYDFGYELNHLKFKDNIGSMPYNAFIASYETSNQTFIFLNGEQIDGILAAVKSFNYDELSNNKNIWIGKDNINALSVFDYLHHPDNIASYNKNSSNFTAIVDNALNGGMSAVEDGNIKKVKTNDGVELRLMHIAPKYTATFKDYLRFVVYEQFPNTSYTSMPVVFGRGLWSNLTSNWLDFGRELSSEGRDVWFIEITGGPGQDCANCTDYTFDDLTDSYWPTLIAGVQAYTGQDKIQYVGHSNGCRTALSSLEKWNNIGRLNVGYYWKDGGWTPISMSPNVTETFVGIGCPGAFEGFSPGQFAIQNTETDSLFQRLEAINKHHITLNDAILYKLVKNGYFMSKDNPFISLNLLKNYTNWIKSDNDVQPGKNLFFDESAIIAGNFFVTSDGIVT